MGNTAAYGGSPVSHSSYTYDHRLIVHRFESCYGPSFPRRAVRMTVCKTNASADNAVYSGAYIDDLKMISDDFGAAPLNTSIWSTVQPARAMHRSASPAKKLTITVPGGVSHDLWTDGYNVPRIMQEVKSNANVYEFAVKFTTPLVGSPPNVMVQGIVVEQDTNNLIRANFSYDGTSVRIFIGGFYDGLVSSGRDHE